MKLLDAILSSLRYRAVRLRWALLKPTTVGARGLLLQDDSVLLVRHRLDGRWYLPGGGVEAGELPAEALRREADEEAGAQLGTLELFGVYSSFYEGKNDHVVVFLCRSASTEFRANVETSAAAFFPLEALPEGVSPGTHRRIEEYRSGEWPRHGRW
ncbi:MAG: NUDIX domain-containing protein [Anaerolineae bacterium]